MRVIDFIERTETRRVSGRGEARARAGVATLACAVLALAFSCASPRKEPLATPALDLTVHHFAGTGLGGPLASIAPDTVDPAPENALDVRCRFVYLDRFPPDALRSMLESARLIIADRGNQVVVLPASRGSRVRVAGDDPGRQFVDDLAAGRFDRTTAAGELTEALPEGVTLVVSCRSPESTSSPNAPAVESTSSTSAPAVHAPDGVVDEPTQRASAMLLTRGRGSESSTITVLLATGDSPREAAEPGTSLTSEIEAETKTSLRTRTGRRGVVLTDAPRVDGAPFVVVIPPPEGVRRAWLAVVVEVGRAKPDSEAAAAHVAAVERCVHDVSAERESASQRSMLVSSEEASMCSLLCALQALEIAGHHRSTLAFLARGSGAPLTESLALTASDDSLTKYIAAVLRDGGGAESLSQVGSALGWRLESAAYRALARWSLSGDITPDLAALLVRHAGESARYPDEIEQLVSSSRDLASLHDHFVADNRHALEDIRPASRVRAFDWLTTQGLAPKDYDPLGPAAERHAALLRADEAQQSAEKDAAHADAKESR
jgi:hypothetical protein